MQEEAQKKGYIKLYRNIENNVLWHLEPFSKAQAWLDLLILTNYKDGLIETKNGSLVNIERGQCGYSTLALADRWQWSRGKVSRFLNLLKKLKMIQQKIVENHSIISVLNYNRYQTEQLTEQQTAQQTGQQTGQQTEQLTEQQTAQQTDTNKKGKNLKKDKNIFIAKSFFQKLIAEDSEVQKFSEIHEVFFEWLDYKTNIKKQYKTEKTVRGAFFDLISLSKSDNTSSNLEISARDHVNYAISKGWQGLYAMPKSAKLALQKERSTGTNNENYGGF